MMKKLLFILFPLFTQAQTLVQLPNAKAYRSTFLPVYVNGLNILQNGLTTSADIWMAGFNLRYDEAGNALPVECVRINSGGATTTKIIPEVPSSPSILWFNLFDSSGNLYISFITSDTDNKVIKFNFKDSIFYESLGGLFQVTPTTVAYSAALGRDGNMIFGSSPGSTFWSEYNTTTHIVTTHPEVDNTQNYALTVQGDSDWVYVQTGQSGWVRYVAVRKSDNYKKTLDSVPSNTRFGTSTFSSGIYMSKGSTQYKVHDTTLTLHPAFPEGTNLYYHETVNGRTTSGGGQKLVTSYFTQPSLIVYSIDHDTASLNVPSSNVPATVRFVYVDSTDTTGLFYVGDYYGVTYRYRLDNDISGTVGTSGYNIYSYIQYNDSIFYFGFYPSATIMKFNKNHSWTLGTYVNGRVADGSQATDNPHTVETLRTQGGFHHPFYIAVASNGDVYAAGDVIRTGNTASLAGFNPATLAAWGVDFTTMPTGISTSDLLAYGNHLLLSTNNLYGGHPKLWFYNTTTKAFDDSLDLGYADYGKLLLSGDTLFMCTPTGIIKMYLPTKTILTTYTMTINNAFRLEHGYMGLNTTAPLPDSAYFIRFAHSNGFSFNDIIYTFDGNSIFKTVDNLYPTPPPVPDHPTPDQFNFIFYPNPATDKVYVIGNGKYYLLDANGALIEERHGSGVFDLSGLSAGTYFINYKKLIVL